MVIEGQLAATGAPVRIECRGSRIGAIQTLDRAPDLWIAPGLIDLQINGFRGHDLNAPDVCSEVVCRLVRSLWELGVTAFCPTVITQSEERICQALRAIAAACEEDARVNHAVVGIHVEGPSISPKDGPRGAHPREHVRAAER